MFLLGLVFGSLILTDFISNFVSTIDSFTNILDWWDLFKNSLKAEIIEFSKRARTKSSHSRVLLTNRLIALKRRLSLRDRFVVWRFLKLSRT